MSIAQRDLKTKQTIHRPNKLLGQHFLKNKSIRTEIIKLLSLEKGDFLIEIGPGNGEITIPIVKNGSFSMFIAIEKDKNLVKDLEKYTNSDFEVIEADALKKLPEILEKTPGKVKIFGNLPYYATGHIFRILWEHREKVALGVFMVQREVAERAVVKQGKMNRLAAFIQSWSDPIIAILVGKKEFSPPPKVDSAVLVLSPLSSILPEDISNTYENLVRCLFAQPRKTAVNNLSEMFVGTTAERKKIAEIFLQKINIKNTARPQDINIFSLISLAKMLYNKPDEAQNT